MKTLKTKLIIHTFSSPVKAPKWWEGHLIHYKEYPQRTKRRSGLGLETVNLSACDGGKQITPPYNIGQKITVSVGGRKMTGEVYSIDVFQGPPAELNPKEAEWKIDVCFPRIPKNHLHPKW